jgi:hypothetical protein
MFAAVAALAGVVRAQTLTDIGAANPTPGPNDIYQLSTNGNTESTGGFNYFSNNNPPPGETFTTGTTPLVLTSVSFKTGSAPLDSGGGGLGPEDYHLRISSVSSSGGATLIDSYASSPVSYTDGHWLQWTNLGGVPLATNTTYAYSFAATSGYDGLALSTNLISGGQAALIPTTSGAVTYDSPAYGAVFDIGLSTNTSQLLGGTPVVSPENTIYVGSAVTLLSSAVGTPPLYYQWQMIGGGGALTNIPNATNSSVSVTPPTTGTFNFDVIVTNSSGSVTSSVATVTVMSPASVTVNTNQMAALPAQGIGVCSATYDNYLIGGNAVNIAPMLKAAGITAVRFPGGSYGDVYSWSNNAGIDGAYVNSSDSFSNWMNDIVMPAGAQAIVTANYGSNPANTAGGDTNVAANWVAYAQQHYGTNAPYWEIGNEIYGNGYYSTTEDWEYDLHYSEASASARVGQPALSPAAYGTNAIQFISAMKAQDANIKCGVFVEGVYSGNNAWNTALLKVCGSVADFVIIHWYPGSSPTTTLAASTGIVATVNATYTQLTNLVGAAKASQMPIAITETGAGDCTGAQVSLFAADNYLTWLENGIVNVDYQILHTDMLLNNQTPGHAYYGTQMCHLLANIGDTFLNTTSSVSELRVHATTRQDGRTGVMLVNLDPILTIPATVNISGKTLATSGIWYQFGLTNYIGTNDYPSFPVSTNTVSGLGNQFTVSVPPYTIVDLLIPALSVGGTATPASPEICNGSGTTISLSGQAGAITGWQYSVNGGSSWTAIASTANPLSTGSLTATTEFEALVQNGTGSSTATSTVATVTVDAASVGGTATPVNPEICNDGVTSTTISLGGQTGTIIGWQYSVNGGSSWTAIASTANPLSTGPLTTTTEFEAVVQSGVCSTTTSSAATVTVDQPSVGGTATPMSPEICNDGVSSTTISLSGQTGTIVGWQYSVNGGSTWTTIASTANPLNTGPLTVTTEFEAVVQSGVCSTTISSAATVTVDQPPVGGTATPTSPEVASGGSTTISLSGQTGAIVGWQYSTNGGVTWTAIASTANPLSTGPLTVTTEFSAVVQSGVCSAATSSAATVTVGPSITTETTNQEACVGSEVTWTVVATGTGLTYQWQLDGTNLVDGGNLSGSLTATLTNSAVSLTNAATVTNGYACIVTDAYSMSVTSTVVSLTVDVASVGGTATATIPELYGGSGTTISLSGQTGAIIGWQYSTDGGNTWTTISSTNNPLSTGPLMATTEFEAVVQSGVCSTAISSAAIVTVQPLPILSVVLASANSITLSWSGSATNGFMLETTTNLNPLGVWSTLFMVTNLNPVTITVSNPASFFRLYQP